MDKGISEEEIPEAVDANWDNSNNSESFTVASYESL